MKRENVRRTDTKQCSVCKSHKVCDSKNFYRNSTCGACYQKAYKLKYPDKYRDIKLRHLYGISLDDYKRMFEEQKGECAICACKQKLVVDHNHRSGLVRALLCHSCNKNVGVFEKWEIQIKAYLEKYQK